MGSLTNDLKTNKQTDKQTTGYSLAVIRRGGHSFWFAFIFHNGSAA